MKNENIETTKMDCTGPFGINMPTNAAANRPPMTREAISATAERMNLLCIVRMKMIV